MTKITKKQVLQLAYQKMVDENIKSLRQLSKIYGLPNNSVYDLKNNKLKMRQDTLLNLMKKLTSTPIAKHIITKSDADQNQEFRQKWEFAFMENARREGENQATKFKVGQIKKACFLFVEDIMNRYVSLEQELNNILNSNTPN